MSRLMPRFIRTNPSLAVFALLATALSGYGQTYFISVFGSSIRADFGLSNTEYGTYYSLATLASALVLLKAGALVDRWSLPAVTSMALGLLALGCLLIGFSPHWLMLIPGFFLIRFGGQGMLAHIGFSAASRYFDRDRGKVMALTVSGFPLAEAILPAAAGLVLASVGWRMPWLAAAAILLVLALPLMRWLSRDAPRPSKIRQQEQVRGEHPGLTRRQALRDPGLYLILPAALAVPFIVTAVLFHQTAIAEARDWPLERVALAFTGFAAGHFLSLFIAGPLVDRLGSRLGLALGLWPMIAGLGVLAITDAIWTPFLYLACTGISQGFASTASNALWPDRYGVGHIGAIRALAQAVMVFSTATSPILAGALLDSGTSPAELALVLGIGAAIASVLVLFAPRTPTNAGG